MPQAKYAFLTIPGRFSDCKDCLDCVGLDRVLGSCAVKTALHGTAPGQRFRASTTSTKPVLTTSHIVAKPLKHATHLVPRTLSRGAFRRQQRCRVQRIEFVRVLYVELF